MLTVSSSLIYRLPALGTGTSNPCTDHEESKHIAEGHVLSTNSKACLRRYKLLNWG
jgi:hypothetical protein